jgi:hypothetical protein
MTKTNRYRAAVKRRAAERRAEERRVEAERRRNADQYRELIHALGLNQTQAAKFFDINARTSRRWAAGDQPDNGVVMLMQVMLKYAISVRTVNKILGREEDHDHQS